MSARTRCSRGAHGVLYAAAVAIWATGAAAAGPEPRVADPPTNGTVIARPFPGKGGRLGVGAGLIAQTNPYREARSTSVRLPYFTEHP